MVLFRLTGLVGLSLNESTSKMFSGVDDQTLTKYLKKEVIQWLSKKRRYPVPIAGRVSPLLSKSRNCSRARVILMILSGVRHAVRHVRLHRMRTVATMETVV